MAAPWVAGAQARIIGEIHGQQTVNVMNFATNTAILDEAALETLLIQLAEALKDCVLTTLLPVVTSDWRIVKTDAKRIYPDISDPVISTASTSDIGTNSPASTSFESSLITLRTGGGGKRGRGRIFLPPAGEADITASRLDPGLLIGLAAFCACMAGKFLGSSPSTAWRLGILSRKALSGVGGTFNNSFRIVTQLSPVATVAVMRSRRIGHGA